MHALPPGRVLLAFSGGPDSVGLAAALRARDPLLAYVDHRLRGRRASREERVRVRAVADALGLELVRTRVAVDGAGEAAARRARYTALHALARRHGCVALALGHTADDRAESILLNLRRGTGLRGLAAPLPTARIAGVLRVRPALDERRTRLRAFAETLGAVDDRANRDLAYARVRCRLLWLPALAARLGDDPVPFLCAIGEEAARVRADLERRAATLREGGRRALLGEPGATFPYLVEAMRGAGPPLTARAYAALRDFLQAGRGDREHRTPGGEAWRLRSGGGVEISRRSPSPCPRPHPPRSSSPSRRDRPSGPS